MKVKRQSLSSFDAKNQIENTYQASEEIFQNIVKTKE